MKRLAVPGRWLALLPAAALVAAACGDGAPSPATPTVLPRETPEATPPASPTPAATPTPAPTPTPTATSSPTLTPTPAPFEGTRGPVEEAAGPVLTVARLVDVRTGQHDGFDRAVFEFEAGLPGFRIEYVEPPIAGGPSGLPVEVEGSAFLRVRFQPAAGYDPFTGDPTYGGPFEIVSGLPSLVELERAEDFEGVLAWALGLNEEVDFRVSALEDPFRVAVDVAHP